MRPSLIGVSVLMGFRSAGQLGLRGHLRRDEAAERMAECGASIDSFEMFLIWKIMKAMKEYTETFSL